MTISRFVVMYSSFHSCTKSYLTNTQWQIQELASCLIYSRP